DEQVRAAVAKAAQAIAQKPTTMQPASAPRPAAPALPAVILRKRPRVETPYGDSRVPTPVASPVPFTIVGTPQPTRAAADEAAIAVAEEPWQDEPVRVSAPSAEIASLLQDYLSKTDPGMKPWPTATAPVDPSAKLATVKLVKKKKPDAQGDDE